MVVLGSQAEVDVMVHVPALAEETVWGTKGLNFQIDLTLLQSCAKIVTITQSWDYHRNIIQASFQSSL